MGLLVSIPIVVCGSQLILKWIERYPMIIYVGAAVLAWTAAKMIVSEPMLKPWFATHPEFAVALYVLVIGGVFASVLLPRRMARS